MQILSKTKGDSLRQEQMTIVYLKAAMRTSGGKFHLGARLGYKKWTSMNERYPAPNLFFTLPSTLTVNFTMPDLEHKQIEFTEFVGEYQGLKVFKPQLPLGAEWFYLGPVAVNFENPIGSHQSGLIIQAEDPSALGDIADWEQVFVDIEGREFSVWRPIPARPDEYVSGGDIFVQGTDKPTPDQTFGIKAIRRDLIGERVPTAQLPHQRNPFAQGAR
ncbi:hypothetical protein D9613_009844 [Agrocybe pediades]|uniref:Uncharacterized protein n=1 Tax=Agrocybe pediades TaxID=84607 RepID=A0A8H4QZ60_9AGAR|nr:hypothetical protein D9613_009844 [Agrocybe pediades]